MGENFAHLPEVFLPALWFSAEASLTSEMADQIWFLVYMPTIVRYLPDPEHGTDLVPGLLYMPTIVRYYSSCPLVQC